MKIVSGIMLMLAALVAGPVQAADWQIDKAHSTVGFTVPHLGISKVSGKFTQYTAEFKADPATGKVQSLEAMVQIASVDTAVEARDNHLRSPDFFDAAKFPTMSFKLTEAQIVGTQAVLKGDLTIKGITKHVVLTGEFHGPQKLNLGQGDQLHSGYSLTTVVNRKFFGLNFDKMVDAVALVGDDVTINLEVEIVKSL